MVYYIIKQEITQEITVRSIFYICWLGLKIRKSGFPMDLKGFETLWSHRRPAGDGQRSTGPLHGMVRIPFPGKNEAHPFGCASFLVDLKGFEPSTPTMRMWCATKWLRTMLPKLPQYGRLFRRKI